MKKPKPTFPWARLMQLGLGTLRLSPSEFWRSTPREIAAAFGSPSQPMLRQKLNEMMERFPDE
jgi:uncharacterized phage protein (TIGR02216 family)